jgi:hypothetical protein
MAQHQRIDLYGVALHGVELHSVALHRIGVCGHKRYSDDVVKMYILFSKPCDFFQGRVTSSKAKLFAKTCEHSQLCEPLTQVMRVTAE